MIIVITNQPDIKYGKIHIFTLKIINSIIVKNFLVDDIFVCTHGKEDNCDCRKPKPGMIHKAAKKWNIDLKKSFVIGDRWKDIESGESAGCKTIFIDYRYNERKPKRYNFKFANNKLLINNIKKII